MDKQQCGRNNGPLRIPIALLYLRSQKVPLLDIVDGYIFNYSKTKKKKKGVYTPTPPYLIFHKVIFPLHLFLSLRQNTLFLPQKRHRIRR